MTNRIQILEHSPAQPLVQEITNDPPEHSAGLRVIIGTSPTGDFTGHPNKIAWSDGTNWHFDQPEKGWRCFVNNEDKDYIFTGTWEILDIHNRLHNIDSSDDHALQAEHANKIVGFDGDGKVAAQPTSQLKTKELKTKELKLPHVISDTAPNVGDHKEGDYWFKPVGQVFILAQSGTTKAWIEITPQKVE